jgi:hypothetical protein
VQRSIKCGIHTCSNGGHFRQALGMDLNLTNSLAGLKDVDFKHLARMTSLLLIVARSSDKFSAAKAADSASMAKM